MPKKHKRTLHIKLALIILVAVFLPLTLAILTTSINPLLSIIAATIVAILAAISLFISLKPLDTLLKGVYNFSAGNLNQRIDLRSGDEFEEVGDSFNLMAEKLSHAIQTLENDKNIISFDKDKLSTILSSIIDGIVAVDLSKNIVLMNKTAERLTSFTQEEVAGRPLDQFLHLFTDTEEVSSDLYCKTNTIQPLNLVGRDGKKIKINLIAAPITQDNQTNLSCILIMHDLSQEQELEQMKFDFVSMASHELKTPLTNIIGYLTVFIDENRTKVRKDEIELLQRSLTSAQQLQVLVTNLLSVNKIERDQISVSIAPVDYQIILQKAVEDMQNQAKQKNITLILKEGMTPIPKVLADPIRLVEVINNLLANAINYTNAGGSINVYTKFELNEVATVVEDSGIGIPKEAIPHLFTKFFRVSNKNQQAAKGTGLGLYISKSIIDKIGGRIWAESEMGKGSKFYFTLPIAPKENLQSIDKQQFIGQSIQQGFLNY
jgi:PAS domain S-box-containing protein